jgi:3-oxoacyl-[acyl-carrier protein] reductase
MDKLREQIPLKRFATEEEVADTILFMINNKYFTGEVIDLDGGSLPKRVVL